MSGDEVVTIVTRWVHISAAVIAIGGAVFQRVAWMPAAEESGDPADRERLREAVRSRWARLVGLCIGLLLLTGFFNLYWLVIRAGVAPMPYHALFGLKFLAAMVVFFLASAMAGKSPAFASLRAKASSVYATIVLLGLFIILLSGVLHQIRHAGG
ncbi:MAG: hypothetical protein D6788_09330 [Planctomycetota bacterium]|nr:MAG: hypothetical protein D6788_09330 [Planctomycetota bacterium]